MAITPMRFILPLVNQSSTPRLEPKETPKQDFALLLKDALVEVNQDQLESARLDRMLAEGKLTNVHDAVIAAEKATLSIELTVQIRNKIIEAYQEVMRMNV
jgi:flagellar hook-basal body complex protein FliE